MSTSFSGQIVTLPAALYGNGEDPVDAYQSQVVANNLLHAADSFGQVRVNIWFPNSFGGNLKTFLTTETPDEVNRWHLIEGFPCGPFPLTLSADGTPYRLIVQIAGSIAAGTGTATFRVVIAPNKASALEGRYESSDRVFQATSNSTTAAILTGTSQGTAGASDYLDVDRDLAASWITDLPIFDAVSSGSPGSVEACMVSAWVFAKTTSTSSIARLHGLRIAEFLAP